MDPESLTLENVCFMLGERDIVIFQQKQKLVELVQANEQAARHISQGLEKIAELEAKIRGEEHGKLE